MKNLLLNEKELTTKDRFKNVIILISIINVPMWFIFLLSNIISFDGIFAIKPRDLNFLEIFGILGSWMNHANINHINSNFWGILGMLFFVGIIENKPLKLMSLMIVFSGLFVWLFGAPNTLHVGASGLVYACFGYILSACFIGKKWLYLVPISASFFVYGTAQFSALMNGLIPQDGISFSGHFGGIIVGVFLGFYYNKNVRFKI